MVVDRSAARTRSSSSARRTRFAFERPDGEIRELSIPVREWRAADALYTQGAIDIIGLLLVALGIGTFLLRPWEPESWALLSITCLSGGALETLYVPQGPDSLVRPLYISALIGFVYVVPFHVALAVPLVQKRLAAGTRAALRDLRAGCRALAA